MTWNAVAASGRTPPTEGKKRERGERPGSQKGNIFHLICSASFSIHAERGVRGRGVHVWLSLRTWTRFKPRNERHFFEKGKRRTRGSARIAGNVSAVAVLFVVSSQEHQVSSFTAVQMVKTAEGKILIRHSGVRLRVMTRVTTFALRSSCII